MKIEDYAALRDNYPMPEDAVAVGTAADPETGDLVAIGIVTRRKTYARAGYLCQKDAPAELHACACALLELIQDMPVIKTVLLKPGDICAKLSDAPPEGLRRPAALCLAALSQTLSACLTELDEID